MLNECFCLFCKHRLRTFCVPGLYHVNPRTVKVITSVPVLRNPWVRQGSRVTGDIMKRGLSAVGSQKSDRVQGGFRSM